MFVIPNKMVSTQINKLKGSLCVSQVTVITLISQGVTGDYKVHRYG